MSRLLIKGALVLRAADTPARRESILIQDGVIQDFLPADATVADAEIMDASNLLLHPGLINAHAHGHTTLAKGTADRWSLELLLASGSSTYGGRRARDKYLSALLGAAEMALKGCTASYDMCMELPGPSVEGVHAVASAYANVGMRAVVAPMMADLSFWRAIPGMADAMPQALRPAFDRPPPSADQLLASMRDIIQNWPAEFAHIKPALAPTIPLHCSDELWTGSRDMAQEFGVLMQCHLQESKAQALSGIQRYGRSLTAYLDSLGVLGPHFTASHGVWLDEADMALLGKAGASVSHNAGSNMILGNGLADARAMLDNGVNVAIGTDGANCSDSQNMYESMRTALRVSHVRSPEMDRWLSAGEVFHMATENGARALGLQDVGRLEAGCQADLVCLDLGHVNWMPVNDVVGQLVQGEDGTSVRHVMVGGKWIVLDKELVNLQIRALRQEVQDTVDHLQERNAEQKEIFKQLQPALRCFCPAFMHTPYTVERFGSAYPPVGSTISKT